MKLLDAIAQSLGYAPQNQIAAKSVDQEGRPRLRAAFLAGQAIPPDMKQEDYLKAYKGWVYDCVAAISQEVGDIDLKLMRRKGEDVEEVKSHPVLDLLHAVNPLYTSYLLWESTQAYIELAGESFWWLTGGTAKNPKEIWTLRPDWLSVRDTKNKIIDTYEYGAPGDKKIVIPFEEIIHFKDFNPLNPYRGYGVVKAQAESIDADNFSRQYNRSFFFNSARPGGVLSTDQNMTDDQYERVRDEWNKVHQGVKKAWKVAILEAGLKWQDVGLNQKEMDFVEGRRFDRDEIFAGFRVPKSIVAISDDVNLAAIREHRAVFLELTIDPKLKRIVSHLNEFLLPRYNDKSLYFDYVSPVPDDSELKLKTYDNAMRHGWMTRNEIRAEENLDPIAGGDDLMVPFSVAPIGSQTPQDKEKAAQRKRMHTNVRVAPKSHEDAVVEDAVGKITEKAQIMLREMLKSKLQRKNENRTEAEEDAREKRWKAMIQRVNPREDQMKRLMFELFNDQEQRVLDRVDLDLDKAFKTKGKKKEVAVKDSVYEVGDVRSDDDIFAAPLQELIRGFIEAEGIVQIQALKENAVFYMQSEAVKKYLLTEAVKFVSAINDETTQQLRQELSDGVSAGESIPQLKARVQSVFEDAKGFRAERIARTETLRATNFATLEAYSQSGVVEAKEWLTTKDERLCPWCAPQDGKVLGLSETFYEKGDTIEGTNEDGKTVRLNIGVADVSAPPLHPNCRCTLIPVLRTLEDDKVAPEAETKTQPKDEKQLIGSLVDATMKEVNEQLHKDQGEAA